MLLQENDQQRGGVMKRSYHHYPKVANPDVFYSSYNRDVAVFNNNKHSFSHQLVKASFSLL